MCWKCDSVEAARPPAKKHGFRLDTWYWFGVFGVVFMVTSVMFFVVGLFR
jgi:hypothetical protein